MSRATDAPQPAPFVLASASPRRRDLLRSAGLRFTIHASDLPENPEPGEEPLRYVARMAREKAWDVARRRRVQGDQRPVLGADTIVVEGQTLLGKPADRNEARQMLARLSGAEHAVITGFCIVDAEGNEHQHQVTTRVRFKQLDADEITAYLETDEWRDKAGSYAIQGRAAHMVREIVGSYTNVVGLPLCEAVEALRGLGLGAGHDH